MVVKNKKSEKLSLTKKVSMHDNLKYIFRSTSSFIKTTKHPFCFKTVCFLTEKITKRGIKGLSFIPVPFDLKKNQMDISTQSNNKFYPKSMLTPSVTPLKLEQKKDLQVKKKFSKVETIYTNKIKFPCSGLLKNASPPLINKFTNLLMRDGKKSKALTILFKALILLKKRVKELNQQEITKIKEIHYNPPLTFALSNLEKTKQREKSFQLTLKSTFELLNRAVENVQPILEVRRKKIAGTNRQIPAIVPKARQETLAIRWVIESARKRKKTRGKDFSHCLSEELIEAFQKKGQPYQKRDALHKTAESNRPFIRYRWW